MPNTSKKLAHSQIVFFEMQMELECLSTVPVALMGQSVESMECTQKTKREGWVANKTMGRTCIYKYLSNIMTFYEHFRFSNQSKMSSERKRKDVAVA